jgi:hypothetical protein
VTGVVGKAGAEEVETGGWRSMTGGEGVMNMLAGRTSKWAKADTAWGEGGRGKAWGGWSLLHFEWMNSKAEEMQKSTLQKALSLKTIADLDDLKELEGVDFSSISEGPFWDKKDEEDSSMSEKRLQVDGIRERGGGPMR